MNSSLSLWDRGSRRGRTSSLVGVRTPTGYSGLAVSRCGRGFPGEAYRFRKRSKFPEEGAENITPPDPKLWVRDGVVRASDGGEPKQYRHLKTFRMLAV